MNFKERLDFNFMRGPCPGYPQYGPYEAPEGIYPGCGQKKLEGGQVERAFMRLRRVGEGEGSILLLVSEPFLSSQ
jgi:hypothetical protein